MNQLTESELLTVKPELLVKGWIPPDLERKLTVVGKSLNRIDGPEKVTGQAKYSGDISLPGMLYAKVLRSPYPHARVVRVDTTKAEALPGVKAILSKNNCSGWHTYWYRVPQPAFPDVVSYVGHEIAVVAAEDIDIARKAIDLIGVEYEPLPAVFDAEEAMKPDAPLVTVMDAPQDPPPTDGYGPRKLNAGNFYGGTPVVLDRGDINDGFAKADVILEKTYRTPFQHHGTLQTRACVADWDGTKLTIHESCQGVWPTALDLAWTLGLPVENVNVVVKYQGGGFGSKTGAHRSMTYAARLSMITKRPVKLELTRAEEFVSHPRRFSAIVRVKTGAKRDGTLTAMCGKVIVNIGAGGGYGVFTDLIIKTPFEMYLCPNAHFEQWGVHTNLQFVGPMRSPGAIESAACFEAHVDELAEACGLDPLEFRLKNYSPFADQVRKTSYSSKKLDKAMRIVTQAIGWEKRLEYFSAPDEGLKRLGIGMASYMCGATGLDPFWAEAKVVISRDSGVQLYAGVVDIGTGIATTIAMIAAEELGVGLSDVRITYGNSGLTPYAPGSHASRVIPELGPAVLQAAADARQKLFALLAKSLHVDSSELRSAEGWIYLASNPSRRIKFSDAYSMIGSDVIVGKGSRVPNPQGGVGFATFGATAVEVEVDTETGEVHVLRVASAHEFGRAVNPKLCNSQHYGGVLMGIGYALFEEPVLDKKTGMMLNTDFHQYRMPTAEDMPLDIMSFNVEGEDKFFAYSAKGGGEYTNTAVAPAIRNAIYNATHVWIDEYPMTPARVLAALENRKGGT